MKQPKKGRQYDCMGNTQLHWDFMKSFMTHAQRKKTSPLLEKRVEATSKQQQNSKDSEKAELLGSAGGAIFSFIKLYVQMES